MGPREVLFYCFYLKWVEQKYNLSFLFQHVAVLHSSKTARDEKRTRGFLELERSSHTSPFFIKVFVYARDNRNHELKKGGEKYERLITTSRFGVY